MALKQMEPNRCTRYRVRWPCDSPETSAWQLLVGGDGAGFVVVDVEDGVKLGELQNVLDLAGQVEQLESGTLILGCGIGANEFAQARAIDVIHVAQIQQDVFGSFADQVANRFAQLHTALAQSDPPAKVQDGDAVQFTGSDCECHGNSSFVSLT